MLGDLIKLFRIDDETGLVAHAREVERVRGDAVAHRKRVDGLARHARDGPLRGVTCIYEHQKMILVTRHSGPAGIP